MSKGLKSGRVLLDEDAVCNLLRMESELKEVGEFIQVNPSKLASWIISRFTKAYFMKDKEVIKKAHFNHQKYLKEALKDAKTEDDLRDALSSVMKKVGRKKRVKKFKTNI